jgi:beta-phosphoglucomutase-like phosphatase (HAD superfamily)
MITGRNTDAVIFDLDGVLTDCEALTNAAVSMFHDKGVVVQPEDFLPFVGTGEDPYIGGMAEKYRCGLDLPVAKKRTYEIYLPLVPKHLSAFPRAVECVQSCRAARCRVAVASSADLIKIEANLRKIGLPPAECDRILSAEYVTHKKPAPDIFLAVARKLGVKLDRCTVIEIEDAVNGVQAAKAVGMRCVAMAHSFPARKLSGGDLVRETIAGIILVDLAGSIRTGQLKEGDHG